MSSYPVCRVASMTPEAVLLLLLLLLYAAG
jgi:hypothetical protein